MPVYRLASIALILCVYGCAAPSRDHGYATTLPAPPHRNTYEAQHHNEEGLRAIEAANYDQAEQLFRQALEADLFYATAHNNLGLVLMKRSKAYEAAWEFQYAAKLMPGAVEPRNNLGLVMERVGRLDEAIDHYEEALALQPNNLEAMGHLARVQIKTHQKTPKLRELLKSVAFQDEDPAWSDWARRQLLIIRWDADH